MRAYIQFNEFTDVISSVKLVADLHVVVQKHPLLWKWIILAAHNGLQGAMVCALSGTDGIGALKPKSQAAVQEWLQTTTNNEYPEEYLADFKTMLAWVQQSKRMMDCRPLELKSPDIKKLQKLNAIRR